MTISARRRRLGGRKPVEASGDSERASASSNVRKKSFVADCNFTTGTLRVIVSLFVSNAEQRRTTMRLSHVSQGFRPTVLDVSWLFTDADWNDWPTPLLDLWCQRNWHGLTVPVSIDHSSQDPSFMRLEAGMHQYTQ